MSSSDMKSKPDLVHLRSELIETEDLVKLVAEPSRVGEVMQVGWESDDEQSDDEELEEDQLRVQWAGSSESEIHQLEEIFVSDKTFIRENLVALKTSHKQSGVIKAIKTFVDLQFLNGKVFKNVPIEKTRFLFDCEADYVVKNECMGVISDQNEFLKVKFGENPREFWIDAADCERHDENEKCLPTEIGVFLPGQKVYIDCFDDLFNNYSKKESERKRTKKKISNKLPPVAVIQEIVVDTLDITWFLLQGNIANIDDTVSTVNPEDVTIVNNPSRHRKISVGCRVLIPDEFTSDIEQYIDEERTTVYAKGNGKRQRKRNKYFRFLQTLPNCGLVIDLHTFYDVRWQDGTFSESIPSTDLIGYDPAGVNEFWENNIVCRAADELDQREVDFTSWGVVKSTNIEDQMVTVLWITKNGNRIPIPETEDISVYSLIHHPEHNNVVPEKLVVRESGNLPFLEAIGEVIEIIDGNCSVCWLNETTSTIGIEEVTFLDDEIEDEECDEFEEDFEEDDAESSSEEENPEESRKLADEAEKEARSEIVVNRAQSESVKDVISYPALKEFARFGSITETPANHHYLKESVTLGPRPSRAVFKDWALLQNNLPEGVFVRSFDSHLDLLQILIIGPKNTPYHDSVFMFDVGFPYDYPKSPPAFFFHSVTGEQINPNLYPTGGICLSLLGTWHGEGVEVWDPTSSTLLQVILSIQGLILGTEEPYFLEAGFEKRKGSSIGSVHSSRYNPTAILGSFKHSIKSYQLAKMDKSYAPELNEILCRHLEATAQITVDRITAYLDFVEMHESASALELHKLFHVPLEGSEGFNQQLRKYRDIYTSEFLK
mmetsp:Transcript_17618/g.27228  ORF Transcript_17618/g.27228 Transcript_17618/m.27228 type:complete len:831 (-) Transcript_17618:23-2515(-)|eukprot:CAMPEP_0117028176 /NCGR_PEP_ID=MMETSP0472-20121206/20508_1 /TAXON_ID=693140 ORGANISM="Tiarina fusus, Strain LIS" /NCGR_SAMPLE_ID=MMETSP0472 /ASSEMBLY_ACC=CAM_ASM_000603 /LENGTH=830 /DNA_ID=CAMNT_0004735587 /DNA_START=20 /DNA_END=2512 /DNA_ORIENTATION=+